MICLSEIPIGTVFQDNKNRRWILWMKYLRELKDNEPFAVDLINYQAPAEPPRPMDVLHLQDYMKRGIFKVIGKVVNGELVIEN